MNSSWNPRIVTVVAAGFLAAACSNHAAPSRSAAAASPPSGGAPATFSSVCKRKLLTADDVTGVLHAPSTAEEVPGDNGSTCKFTTADFSSLTVRLRPGMGKSTLAVWRSGKMPVSGVAEPGVGDEAVWVERTHEVAARKDDLLCDIQVRGVDKNRPGASLADLRRGAGALCNKIFAATP